DKADPNNRTSNITLIGTLTTKSQKNIKLLTDLWTTDNAYHIVSELRYRDWPFNFYGLGTDTWLADEDFLEQQLVRTRIEVEKRIAANWYVGVDANYEYFKFAARYPGGIFERP